MSEQAKRQDIMLCYPFEERRLLESKFKWRFPVIVQPKLDGERCRALNASGMTTLVSSQLNIFSSVPHIKEALEELCPGTVELDGELYVHGWEFPEIHSVVSRSPQNLHEAYRAMEYWIFDLVDMSEPQAGRIIKSYEIIPKDHPHLKLVPYHIANNLPEIMEVFKRYIDEGFEGIIVRDAFAQYVRRRSNRVLKFKPKKFDHYQIIDVTEAISVKGELKGMVGSFICTDTEGNIFNVGAGTLNHKRRKEIWQMRESVIGKTCVVQYQHLTPNRIPRFGLCLDVLN